MNDDIVGRPLAWNLSQDRMVYVAKRKAKEQQNYFQDGSDSQVASTYRQYQQDWGETLSDVVDTSMYVFDVAREELYEVCCVM